MGYGELLDVRATDWAELRVWISHRVAVGAEAGRWGRSRLRGRCWLLYRLL